MLVSVTVLLEMARTDHYLLNKQALEIFRIKSKF